MLNRFLRTCLLPVALCAALPASAQDMVDVIKRVKPAVVAVGTFQQTRSPAADFRGTGFAVGDGLSVITNAHVLPPSLNTTGNTPFSTYAPFGRSGRYIYGRATYAF